MLHFDPAGKLTAIGVIFTGDLGPFLTTAQFIEEAAFTGFHILEDIGIRILFFMDRCSVQTVKHFDLSKCMCRQHKH